MKCLNNESGQALILVMMVMTIMLLMGSSMLTQSDQSRKAFFEEKKTVQACYIAEAGVEKVIAEIKNNPFGLKAMVLDSFVTYIGFPAVAYMGGQITSVTVKKTSATANPTMFYIESLGEYQGARRTIIVSGEMYDAAAIPGRGWSNALDERWYARNADRILTGDVSGMFNVDGISYTSGNISLSGTYSGAGVIVAGGKVTINGDLNRENTDSSLAIISFGDPTGIETADNLSIQALLYTPNSVSLGENTHVYGSAVCNMINTGLEATVTEDTALQGKQPGWTTTVIRITSWKEKYSVF